MRIKVLGTAAGGGFPQWNCGCPTCLLARKGEGAARARTNDSLAISDDGEAWYLLNATPDVCAQIESAPQLHPRSVRGTPIAGVLLTDAELDHTVGLLSLRQGTELDVYASLPVLEALAGVFPVRRIVEPYADFRWRAALPWESFPLFGGNLIVVPFSLGRKPPRYASGGREEEEAPWVIGYRIEDARTGGAVVYASGIEEWTEELDRQTANADCVFADGTFWRSDELRGLGVSELTAAEMGHLPIAGPDGSLERLARLPAKRKIYIHVNNTNPILDESSAERRRLREKGIEIGFDGMELEV